MKQTILKRGIQFLKYTLSSNFYKVRFAFNKFKARLFFPLKWNRFKTHILHTSADVNDARKTILSLRENVGSLCENINDPMVNNDGILTIIIPVYNVECYIKECLDSILCQETSYSYKIHIIDDGSTDNTLLIVNDYVVRYKSITVTCQENSSQSVARNNALNMCDSEWVMMVDGDDLLPPGSIQTLMDIAVKENCDVVEGCVQSFYDKNSLKNSSCRKSKLSIYNNSKKQKYVLTSKGYSCGKVYRRTLWNDVRYPKRYIFEDIVTKYIICRKSKKYARTNQIVYNYRLRQGSSSHSGDNRKLDCLWVMDKIQKIRVSNNIPNDAINHILMMNHFGMLTPLMVSNLEYKYQKAAISIACDYIVRWKVERSNLPYFFKKSYDAIIAQNVEAWFWVFQTIRDYNFIKNYREIN